MEPAKTVRIVYPANLRVGYCQIPASEYDPEVHTLWVDPDAEQNQDTGISVVKGSKGLWFVKQDGKNIGKGFPTEEEAKAEADKITAAAAA